MMDKWESGDIKMWKMSLFHPQLSLKLFFLCWCLLPSNILKNLGCKQKLPFPTWPFFKTSKEVLQLFLLVLTLRLKKEGNKVYFVNSTSILIKYLYVTGHFARLILQIPVRNGFRGGEYQMKKGNQIGPQFKTSRNSHKYYHLTLFYNDLQIITEPVTTGARLELVFDLCHVARVPVDQNITPLYRMWQIPAAPPQATTPQPFEGVIDFWKKPDHDWVDLFAIPLDHSYSEENLSFASLKGVDRTTAQQILSSLGDVAEAHLATVTKYIGYKENDWETSGMKAMKKKHGGKLPSIIRERDWTEYLAGNWVDLQDRKLSLPPLEIFLPDELLGREETVFQLDPTKPKIYSKHEGLELKRQMIILWPRNKTVSLALAFGVDQAIDAVENKESSSSDVKKKENQIVSLIRYCEEHPNETWLANQGRTCFDLRCVNARDNNLKVASKRALRLINLCIKWKLNTCGLKLVNLLFKMDFERDSYCCYNCTTNKFSTPLVGGICSNDVASALAELIVMVGWNTVFKDNISKFLTSENFDVKQIGPFAHLAICLVGRNCLEGAKIVRDEVFAVLEKYLKMLNGEILGFCLAMLSLIDGPSSGDLQLLLVNLKSFSEEHSSIVIGWLSEIDATLLKSLPSYWEFYVELLVNLESQLKVCNPPESFEIVESFTTQQVAAAQLMSSYLKLQDGPMLSALIDRITSPTSRMLLSSVLSARTLWTGPSLVKETLSQLVSARIQQLSQFKTSVISWEQPDAVLPEHPAVETFLRSSAESVMYNNSFASEQDVLDFDTKFFNYNSVERGYSAVCTPVRAFHEGESNEKVLVRIRKTVDIWKSLLKQLQELQKLLQVKMQDSEWAPSGFVPANKRPMDSVSTGQKKRKTSADAV